MKTILDLGNKWKTMVGSMFRQRYAREIVSDTCGQEAGSAPQPVWTQ
jgi:hypothetical protein